MTQETRHQTGANDLFPVSQETHMRFDANFSSESRLFAKASPLIRFIQVLKIQSLLQLICMFSANTCQRKIPSCSSCDQPQATGDTGFTKASDFAHRSILCLYDEFHNLKTRCFSTTGFCTGVRTRTVFLEKSTRPLIPVSPCNKRLITGLC